MSTKKRERLDQLSHPDPPKQKRGHDGFENALESKL